MTAPQPALPEVKPAFSPTPAQLQREARLKRFNRLFVYAPLVLVSLVVLALLILMLWRVFTTEPGSGVYQFLSGMADLILILNLIPMMLLCLIGPALLAFLVRASFKRPDPEAPRQHGRLQTLLWRVDHMIGTLRDKLRDTYLDKGVRPVIIGHALAAAVAAVLRYIQNIFWTRKE